MRESSRYSSLRSHNRWRSGLEHAALLKISDSRHRGPVSLFSICHEPRVARIPHRIVILAVHFFGVVIKMYRSGHRKAVEISMSSRPCFSDMSATYAPTSRVCVGGQLLRVKYLSRGVKWLLRYEQAIMCLPSTFCHFFLHKKNKNRLTLSRVNEPLDTSGPKSCKIFQRKLKEAIKNSRWCHLDFSRCQVAASL